jgi:nucleoside-diphosphate-sugar epimerase
LRRRESRAVIKPGQVFNRIHVEDIATALEAAIARAGERSGARIYNITDDEPAPPQEVLDYAADLIGVPHPPRVPFEEADMSPMARSFYSDNKRTANARMKAELGVQLRYPTYREGLRALAAQT